MGNAGETKSEIWSLMPQTVVNETKTMIWEKQQILFLELWILKN